MEIQTRKWRSLRHKMAPSSGMIRVSRSPVIPNWLQKTLFRPWKLGQACAHTADVLHANSFSLATAVKNSTQKGGKWLIFSNQFRNPGLLEFRITPDRLYEHILFYFIFGGGVLHVFKQVHIFKNVANLFCCEAPGMFCGLRNSTWLSISMTVTRY